MYTSDKPMVKQLVSTIAKRMAWVSELPGSAELLFAAWGEKEKKGEKQNLWHSFLSLLWSQQHQLRSDFIVLICKLYTWTQTEPHQPTEIKGPTCAAFNLVSFSSHECRMEPQPAWESPQSSLQGASANPNHCPSPTWAAKLFLLHIPTPAEAVISTNRASSAPQNQ